MGLLFGQGNKDHILRQYDNAERQLQQQKADNAYQTYYNQALYNANKDYYNQRGITENDLGSIQDVEKAYNQQSKTLADERDKAEFANKYNVFGNGLAGAVLNPFVGAGDLAKDMFTDFGKSIGNTYSGITTGDWNKYELNADKRYSGDNRAATLKQDIGNTLMAGATALTGVAGMGGSAAATPLSTALTGSFASKPAQYAYSTGLGGLYGAGLEMAGNRDSTVGSIAGSAARGGAYGAALKGISSGIDALGNKAIADRSSYANAENVAKSGENTLKSMAKDVLNNPGEYSDDLVNAVKKGAIYEGNQSGQGVIKYTGWQSDPIGYNIDSETAYKLLKEWSKKANVKTMDEAWLKLGGTKTVDNTIAKTRLGRAAQGVGDIAKQSGVGTKISNLLGKKGTKTALKIGGAGGAGLLLSRLLNKKSNNEELSDEEMQQLINYYYGGNQ